jgi:hypothetical protein
VTETPATGRPLDVSVTVPATVPNWAGTSAAALPAVALLTVALPAVA